MHGSACECGWVRAVGVHLCDMLTVQGFYPGGHIDGVLDTKPSLANIATAPSIHSPLPTYHHCMLTPTSHLIQPSFSSTQYSSIEVAATIPLEQQNI